jgi:hypothetical protein
VSSGVLLFFKSNKNNFKIVTPELELMGLGIGDWGLWIVDWGLWIGDWVKMDSSNTKPKH